MLIEAICRLAFRDTSRKVETRSFMFDATENAISTLSSLRKVLISEYGLTSWVASFGVGDHKTSVALKRLARDPEFPQGRMLMAETEVEWKNLRNFLFSQPKTHSFYCEFIKQNFCGPTKISCCTHLCRMVYSRKHLYPT